MNCYKNAIIKIKTYKKTNKKFELYGKYTVYLYLITPNSSNSIV